MGFVKADYEWWEADLDKTFERARKNDIDPQSCQGLNFPSTHPPSSSFFAKATQDKRLRRIKAARLTDNECRRAGDC
jgi:hypothetical protein